MNQQLNNITPKELKLLFRLDGNDPCREHLIGYVRGDFGKSGNEFYTTWFPEDDSKARTPTRRFYGVFGTWRPIAEKIRRNRYFTVTANQRIMRGK